MSTPATVLPFARAWMLLRDIATELRIHQWVKNLLVFVSPLLAHALGQSGAFVTACWVFVAFCAASSGVYVINDLYDLEADRSHPRKRNRPFASGRLPEWLGAMGPALMLAGIVMAWAISPATGLIVVGYIGVSLGYSVYLKTQPLVDIFALSLLYTLRLFAGQVALHIEPSIWLVSFSGFLFLGLAILKRYAEFHAIALSGNSYHSRRGYSAADVELLRTMGMACTFSSAVVLALYLNSESAILKNANVQFLWVMVPILLFWQLRMWLAAARGKMTDDPIVYAARDSTSKLCLVLIVAAYLVALYL